MAKEEKLARRKRAQWKAKTERGRRLTALLKQGLSERKPLLSEVQVGQELRKRRGRGF